ncbi:HEAT repeat domain-containing protein [Kamptonema sp. UHCC 0994]|uniref:HEAT repeat domain-containing protein n=1 Tax=Kamptonema sp. UHCC 0994 TaxID=3031329 RepID=UPI0023B9BAF8|nr:HEAT repeat domain-containing protein [Kamptonema sp. UHCC 0994]MDF0552464.1 HEAT repeat domain-containing protein [Kamptonema sp. UHCC 0994]
MTKHYPQKLAAILTFTLLSCGAPLLLSANALALENRKPEVATTEIAPLIAKLKSNDERELNAAIEKLRKIGEPAIPALIQALGDKNLLVRRSAGEVLGKIGKPAIPALVQALKDSDVQIRRRAANVLAIIIDSTRITYSNWEKSPEAKTVVSALIPLLKDSDANVLSSAAEALGNIGAEAKTAVPALISLLKDSNAEVRRSAAIALGRIGEAKATVPKLIPLLKDSNADVRRSVASALGSIDAEAKTVVSALIPLLKDSNAEVRWSVASTLGSIGVEAKTVVSALIPLLKDSNAEVRNRASYALANIGAEAKAAVPALIPLLKDFHPEVEVHLSAAYALVNIGAEAKAAVPALIPLLKDSDAGLRRRVAEILGSIGAEAKAAVPGLIPLLKDSDADVRRNTASALKKIALNIQDQAKTLSPAELDKVIRQFETALKILEDPKAEFFKEDIATVRLSIEALKAKRNAHLFNLIRQNKWVAVAIIYLIFFPALWSAILRLRPLWILQINNALKSYDFKLPETWGGAPIRIRDLTFIRFFIYHPRVLDAWVSTHIETVRQQFTTQETVKIRATYIPVSFEVDDKKVTEIRGSELQSTFTKNRIRLLIWGEGGIGKTSIACQIADWAMEPEQNKRLSKHLMIPILIEEELKNVNEGKDSFLTAINGQLKSIADLPKPIDEELLKQLLQQRRLLVIVDHFSEMSEATQKAILPNSPDFPVNALVVTSRLDSSLGKANKTTLHPLRIEGSELSDFMQKYLEKLGKGDIYNGSQFHYACGDLAKLLEGISSQERSTTVLFAKLYADLLIAKKENNTSENLPQNIPDLMLSYLNEINRDVAEDKLSDNEVHEIAKMLAWECLKVTYRPTSIKIKDALNALSLLNLQDTEERLKYLEDKLRILQRKGSSQDNISFVLDPVAEYLAGLHLVDICAKNQSNWQKILDRADSLNSPEAIKGFMLAVRDCYLAKIPDAKATDYLPNEIATRYNIPVAAAQSSQPVAV